MTEVASLRMCAIEVAQEHQQPANCPSYDDDDYVAVKRLEWMPLQHGQVVLVDDEMKVPLLHHERRHSNCLFFSSGL